MDKGYCIRYEGTNHSPSHKHTGKTKRYLLCVLLVSFVLAGTLFTNLRQQLYSFIIPGNDAVTVQAFDTLVHSLSEGKEPVKALTAFCSDIVFADG